MWVLHWWRVHGIMAREALRRLRRPRFARSCSRSSLSGAEALLTANDSPTLIDSSEKFLKIFAKNFCVHHASEKFHLTNRKSVLY